MRRYNVVNAASATESNNKNLRKDNFIDPANMGANILIRGTKHNTRTARKVLCFNLSLYDSIIEEDVLIFLEINELPFFDRKK